MPAPPKDSGGAEGVLRVNQFLWRAVGVFAPFLTSAFPLCCVLCSTIWYAVEHLSLYFHRLRGYHSHFSYYVSHLALSPLRPLPTMYVQSVHFMHYSATAFSKSADSVQAHTLFGHACDNAISKQAEHRSVLQP